MIVLVVGFVSLLLKMVGVLILIEIIKTVTIQLNIDHKNNDCNNN